MKVYKDIFSGDELFSDTYPKKLIENCMYEVYGRQLTHNIYRKDTKEINCYKGIDLILTSKLVKIKFPSKEHFINHMNKYLKKLVSNMRDGGKRADVPQFKMNIKKVFKSLLNKFDYLQFYTGESMDAEAMILILHIKNYNGQKTHCIMAIRNGLCVEDKPDGGTIDKEKLFFKYKIFARKQSYSEELSRHTLLNDPFYVPDTPEKVSTNLSIDQTSPVIERAAKYKKLSTEIGTSKISRESLNSLSRKPIRKLASEKAFVASDFAFQDMHSIIDSTADEGSNSEKQVKDTGFAYIGKTVKSKEGRKKLHGFACRDCENYYNMKLEEGFSNEQIVKLINKCSKHRGAYKPPLTPEKFWYADIIEGDPESPRNLTQPGSPFNTRERRRAIAREKKNALRRLETS